MPHRARRFAVTGSVANSVGAGKGTIALGAVLKRLHVLKPSKLALMVTATDPAGNRSAPTSVRLALCR